MNAAEARRILIDVRYLDWAFAVGEEVRGEATYLQVHWKAPDVDTGEMIRQTGRKWRLSSHMTKSEVVQTALKAVLTAVEHEVRENFTYDGVRIFGPHFDVDDLVALARVAKPDVRA